MKKRGFTLIELLAVIVVLAIIALIATPIVMNVIKKASAGAAERSADNYIKAVDTLIATEKLDGTPVADGEYEIKTDGNLAFGNVEVSGTKPVGGTIVVKDGQVVKSSSEIEYEDYTVKFEDGVAKAEEKEEVVKLCNLVNGYTANTVGAKYSCNLGDGNRNFYVLEAGTEDKLATLILEGNYDTTTQLWYSPEEGVCGELGEEIINKLDQISQAWTEINRDQITIPSVDQLLVADGKTAGNINQTLSNEWLYSWPNVEIWGPYWTDSGTNPDNINAYWTSTPNQPCFDGYKAPGTVVFYDGTFGEGETTYAPGIRPIISIEL